MVIIKLWNTWWDDITKFESRVQDWEDALKARVDSNWESLKCDIAKFEARMNKWKNFNDIIKSIISWLNNNNNNDIIIPKEQKYKLKNQKTNPVLEEIIKGLNMADSNLNPIEINERPREKLNPIDKKNIKDKASV